MDWYGCLPRTALLDAMVRRSTGGKWYLVQHSDIRNGILGNGRKRLSRQITDVLLILLMTLLAAVTPCRPEICSFSSHR